MINVVKSPQDIETFESIPFSERQLPLSTYEYLQQGCELNPNKIALEYFLRADEYAPEKVSLKNKFIDKALRLISGERYAAPYIKYTFKEVHQKVNQTANFLTDLGIGKDDVVSLILPNFSETYFCLWGAEAAGIVNPLNPMFEANIMRDVMNAAGSKVLITIGDIPGSDIWQKVNSIIDEVPTLEKVIIVHGKAPTRKDCLRYWKEVERFNGDKLDSNRQIQADDIASMFHTGGTTGIPKIALHTHANEVAISWLINNSTDVNVDDVTLVGLPLFHVNGSLGSGLSSWTRGASVVMAGPAGYRTQGLFDNFFDVLARHKVSWFSVVPTILSVLLDKPVPKALDLSSLRFVICGAAPLSQEVFHTFSKRFNLNIYEVYGLTEATLLSTICPPEENPRVGSVGLHLPYINMKVFKLDRDGNFERECNADEIGVFVVSGPTVFPGYKEEVHNKNVWIIDDEGHQWLNTGDLGRQDSDGYFWITGREKELIIRGGHNIDPVMIEEVLYKHPEVSMAAAIGRPDAYATELPVAYVSLVEGSNITVAELEAYAKANIPERAAIPKAIIIVDDLPLTAVGKIFKPALVWREVEYVYRQVLEDMNAKITVQDIDVINDKKHGTFATVKILVNAQVEGEDIALQAKQLLGKLPTKFELLITDS